MWRFLKQTILKTIGKKNAERVYIFKVLMSYFIHKYSNCLTSYSSVKTSSTKNTLKLCSGEKQTFFGYYDITPFSKNGKYVLSLSCRRSIRPPAPNDEITIGYFDLSPKRRFYKVDKTTTWCWQQGCRLQWFPENENELIIYNRIVDRAYGSVVQHIHTKKIIRRYKQPIYSMDKAGKFVISLNFSRLNRLRPGYGYSNLPDLTKNDLHPDYDGVSLINLDTGDAKLILSLDYLANFEPMPSMEKAEHYINHLCFNPTGDKFIFFHLWQKDGGTHNRLIVCDRSGDNLQVLENQKEVSHYAWKSDRDLLTTVLFTKETAEYRLYDCLKKGYTVIGKNILDEDGHPSYCPGNSLLLTDTYPDKFGYQSLLLYHSGGKLFELGRYLSPIFTRFRYRGEARCDLHPRWDRTGQKVCFDSAHGGKRALYVIALKKAELNFGS